jgi:2-oxoglutarate dehydrogenase E1 component
LRRQMLNSARKPLVIMSPKSLLRHPRAVSDRDAFTEGQFHEVLADGHALAPPSEIERLVLCSGKVYYDLIEARESLGLNKVGVLRIEQLYPFPEGPLSEMLAQYDNVKETVWCQEEPMNQGAWYSSQHHMRRVLRLHYPDLMLKYAGRRASAAAAAGNMGLHTKQQQELIDLALRGDGTEVLE